MKKIINKFIYFLCAVLLIVNSKQLSAQAINVNNTPLVSSCNLGGFGNVTIQAPTEALTGNNIGLNITLPGNLPQSCNKVVTITTTPNLQFVLSGAIPFTTTSPYTNIPVLPGNVGQNFNVFFRFPGGVTCNNATGTFTVVVSSVCNGQTISCTTNVTVTARAQNYWSITKQFVAGNLVCGQSTWRFLVTHNNPNGTGLGAYNLLGTITETTTLPIISGNTHNVNLSHLQNGSAIYTTVLQNCLPQGSAINNTANHNFNLGSSPNFCGTLNGTVNALSPPLAAPNATISFTKTTQSNGNLAPGCTGRFNIQIFNNGNTNWTNLSVQDNLTIPGINVTSVILPAGWTQTPGGLTGLQTFSNPGFVLVPGASVFITINFTVTGTAGNIVTNTATLSYQGGGGNGGGGGTNVCPGINCPTISTAIQNTTATTQFTIVTPTPVLRLRKCIVNPPNNLNPPIYQIGSTIRFRLQVSNSGSGVLNTTITDNLGTPQNLQIVGPISYLYYPNQGNSFNNVCFTPSLAGVAPPFGVTYNNNATAPSWNITNMPGNCQFGFANYLYIEFDATILPQLNGTRTNTASATNGTATPVTSSIQYSIDQVGILSVNKSASQQFVEQNNPFNFIVTVTNNGSVPLNNVVINDILPNCVTRNGNPTVTLNGSPVSSTSTAGLNLIVTINAASLINPGESFVITIPVIKNNGAQCCNETVVATARMTTTGTQLSSNFGSPQSPAACVTSTLCCDIPRLQTTLTAVNPTFGSPYFNLFVNSGGTLIQDVEVSMLDYHITYSNSLCKPLNLGKMGILTSPTALTGLLINNNGTHSINWAAGSPLALNNNIRLFVTRPSILNLSCCDGRFFFCLKVVVKDVDCKVCERIVCGSMNLKDNSIVIDPWDPVDVTPIDTWPTKKVNSLIIRPEFKELYERMKLLRVGAEYHEPIDKNPEPPTDSNNDPR